MKVSAIWRLATVFFLGMVIGCVLAFYIAVKHVKNNTPPGQEITIGKVKIKGNDNSGIIDIQATQDNDTELTKREQRKLKRQNK